MTSREQLTIEIRVRPNAKKTSVGGVAGDPPRLVVTVQAPAVEGKANEAVREALAKAFQLKPRDITIVFGELTRDKRVLLTGENLQTKFAELKGTL